jgi:hypothetical protein
MSHGTHRECILGGEDDNKAFFEALRPLGQAFAMRKMKTTVRSQHKILAVALLFCLTAGMAAYGDQNDDFVGTTSTQPAKKWEEAFLSGNGTMGVMMFGEPYRETVVLNHHKLYLPLGRRKAEEKGTGAFIDEVFGFS